MKKYLMIFMLALLVSPVFTYAQVTTPRPSPLGKVTQAVGFAELSFEYSRPGVKDRKIFGDLVPYGSLWRTGANAATVFTTDEDITIEGKELKAGVYSVFTIPNADKWTLIFNKDTKASTGSYSKEKDALVIQATPKKLTNKVETFTINFTEVTTNSTVVELAWENTGVYFTIETNVDEQVERQIKQFIYGEDPYSYYTAAVYYLENDKDIKAAQEWMNKAASMTEDDPKFWMWYRKALVEEKAGDTKEALKSAQKSLKLAKDANNNDYIALNNKLIERLKGEKKK